MRLPSTEREANRPWADRIMPYYDEMKTLPPWQRPSFVGQTAAKTNCAVNTIQRQFAALLFLETQGKDPRKLRAGVSLLSIETVAKIVRADQEKGRRLLEETLEHKWTARQLTDLYNLHYRSRASAGGYNKRSGALASL